MLPNVGDAVVFRLWWGFRAGNVESVHTSFPFDVDDSVIVSGELPAAVVNVWDTGRHVVALSDIVNLP